MTSVPGNTRRSSRALRASDGFGPLESPALPRTQQPPRIPCLAGRWFSSRPAPPKADPAPHLPTLAPGLVSD